MAGEAETPTSYIQHHLQNLVYSEAGGVHGSTANDGFWSINLDTILTSVTMGLIVTFLFWIATRRATSGVPGRWQAFVEILSLIHI